MPISILIAAVLSVSPSEMLVLQSPPDAIREEALLAMLGKDAVSGTGVWTPLFDPPGMIPVLNFSDPPPPQWPKALAADWTNTLTLYGKALGPPPYLGRRGGTWAGLSSSAAEGLWQRYLLLVKPGAVTEVKVSQRKEDAPYDVVMERYVPNVPGARVLKATVPRAELSRELPQMLVRLKANEGTARPRGVLKSFVRENPGFTFSKPAANAALAVPPGCALPSLAIKTQGPTADALRARWAATVAKGTGEQACELTVISDYVVINDPIEFEGESVIAGLRCAGLSPMTANVVPSVVMGKTAPIDVLTAKLLESVIAERCAAK